MAEALWIYLEEAQCTLKVNTQSNLYQSFIDMSDEELVACAQNGDSDAEEYILEKFKKIVYLKTRKYFMRGAERDDLIQEGMIGLCKAIRDFLPDKGITFRTFADLCVTRQVITAVKTSTRQKHLALNSAQSLDKSLYEDGSDISMLDLLPNIKAVNPEDTIISQERLDGLHKSLRHSLTNLEFNVLVLYLQRLSYNTIACKLNVSVKAVDNALTRVKHKMHKRILEDAL